MRNKIPFQIFIFKDISKDLGILFNILKVTDQN
jgi:hypothetical protein